MFTYYFLSIVLLFNRRLNTIYSDYGLLSCNSSEILPLLLFIYYFVSVFMPQQTLGGQKTMYGRWFLPAKSGSLGSFLLGLSGWQQAPISTQPSSQPILYNSCGNLVT